MKRNELRSSDSLVNSVGFDFIRLLETIVNILNIFSVIYYINNNVPRMQLLVRGFSYGMFNRQPSNGSVSLFHN